MLTREDLIKFNLAAGYEDIMAVARADRYLEIQEKFYSWYTKPEDYDPTPWCHWCGAMTKDACHCGPIADNH